MKKGKGIAAIVVIAALGIGGYALYSQGILGGNSAAPKESTFQEFTDKDVVYTDEHIPYVDSQIVLTGTKDSDYAKIQKRVEKYDGQIVGYLPVTKDYQIQFDGKNYEELNQIVEDFSSWDQIEDAGLHEVFQVSEQTQDGQDSSSDKKQQNNNQVWEGDPWNGASWSISNPDKEDENWWAEAIRMPEVWRMNHAIEYEPVKVGVFEVGYINSEHEELKNHFADMSHNSKQDLGDHGTAVCGILAAEQGNGKGFAGVAQNANLYGYSYDGKEETFESVMGFEFGITELLNEDVKVINMSIGASSMTGPAFYGGEENLARRQLETYNAKLRSFLQKYIDAGYDFLIVKAAGNESNIEWTQTDVSDEYPYGYKRTGNVLSESQNVDAKYDLFSGIEDANGTSVKDHIVVVGSTRLDLNSDASATYNISTMSETGDRVDVYAPGDNIYTCKINDGEYSMDDSGTSFSAPMVTGTASLVWGIQPDLSAKQVRDIILEGATTEISGSDKHMLNVWESVYRAVMTEDNSKLQEQIKQYSVLGFVKDSDDKALEGATVTLYTKADDCSESICTAQTDSEGVFDMVIARKSEWMTDPDWERIDGKLVISKDGYTQVEKEISLSTVEPVVYVDDIQMDNKLLKQLTDGYWWNKIQDVGAYKFREDGTWGTVPCTYPENYVSGEPLVITGKAFTRVGTYEIKGDKLFLYYDDFDSSTCLLYGTREKIANDLSTDDAKDEWKTQDYPRQYMKEAGIDKELLYETNFKIQDEEGSDNAYWLLPYEGNTVTSEEENNVTSETSNASSNNSSTYQERINQLWDEYNQCANVTESQMAINRAYGTNATNWDNLMNDIYGTIREKISSSEFETLKTSQKEWLAKRENDAKESASDWEGGSGYNMAYYAALAESTGQRCEWLVDQYLK